MEGNATLTMVMSSTIISIPVHSLNLFTSQDEPRGGKSSGR
jgi:hypothetical protein